MPCILPVLTCLGEKHKNLRVVGNFPPLTRCRLLWGVSALSAARQASGGRGQKQVDKETEPCNLVNDFLTLGVYFLFHHVLVVF